MHIVGVGNGHPEGLAVMVSVVGLLLIVAAGGVVLVLAVLGAVLLLTRDRGPGGGDEE